MKVSRKQLRKIIREELIRLDEAMPASGVPDVVGAITGVYGEENRRKAVELTELPDESDVNAAWPEHVYHNGSKVFDTFYGDNAADAYDWLSSEGYDGQEVYLGYDPQSDNFVMGFDAFYDEVDEYGNSDHGEMEGVLLLLDPRGRVLETITSVPGGIYPEGRRAAKTAMPAIIDVRLD